MRIVKSGAGGVAEIGAGAQWSAVVSAANAQKLTPPAIVDTFLSVGGTISTGGFAVTSFNQGFQVDHVQELEVVTGDGQLVTCSDERNSELFNAMLGGLGQCGIIVKVVMRLIAAPTHVLFLRMNYDDFQTASVDLALLAKDGRFHHLDGRGTARQGGGVAYYVEGGAFYDAPNAPDEAKLSTGLKFASKIATVMTYEQYYRREEVCTPCTTPQQKPFVYLCLPASRYVEYTSSVLSSPAEFGVSHPAHVGVAPECHQTSADPAAGRGDRFQVPAFTGVADIDGHAIHDRAQSHAVRTGARHGRIPNDVERGSVLASRLDATLRTGLAVRPGGQDTVRPQQRSDPGTWNVSRLTAKQETAMNHVAGLALSLGIALAPGVVQAQDAWPSRAVTLLVPYGAGGYTDLVGRLTARYLEKALGKPVVVENRAGAGGIVGTQFVANAAPDGYTFCVCSIGAISVAPFYQKVGYDPVQDLAPVGIVSSIVQTVIVKKDMPVKTINELVTYLKANPGKLNYGSSGAGGLTHFSVELFQARTGTKAVHVPFKSGANATAAVVAGEVDLSFANMTDALPQVTAATVRGLAVTSLGRSPYFPDLPSLHETVVPNFLVETWNGIMAPAKTPQAIISKLSEILIKMADDSGMKEIMRRSGATTVKTTPEEFRAQIEQEIAQWKPLIKEIAESEKK